MDTVRLGAAATRTAIQKRLVSTTNVRIHAMLREHVDRILFVRLVITFLLVLVPLGLKVIPSHNRDASAYQLFARLPISAPQDTCASEINVVYRAKTQMHVPSEKGVTTVFVLRCVTRITTVYPEKYATMTEFVKSDVIRIRTAQLPKCALITNASALQDS